MRDFAADTGVDSFEHLIDEDGAVWAALNVADQPAFAFVDNGTDVDVHVGALGVEELTSRALALIES